MYVIAKAAHLLSALVWVGGMFFAYMVLRRAAGPLEPPERQKLWARVFGRFFPWVWAAVILLIASGNWMIVVERGGFAAQPHGVHLMQALGYVMILIFLHLYFAPYRRFRAAVAAGDFAAGGAQLERIRVMVGVNMVLGLVNAALGASLPHWS